MKLIQIFIEGTPVAQPRQRHRIAGKGRKQFVQSYTPANHPVQYWKRILAADFTINTRKSDYEPADGPIIVDLVFALPRPTSKIRKTIPNDRYWLAQKPDKDNLEKAVFDGLNGIAWQDDALIVSGRTDCFVCGDCDLSGVAITITKAPQNVSTWADTLIHEETEKLF